MVSVTHATIGDGFPRFLVRDRRQSPSVNNRSRSRHIQMIEYRLCSVIDSLANDSSRISNSVMSSRSVLKAGHAASSSIF
jgi:hypothetical protein